VLVDLFVNYDCSLQVCTARALRRLIGAAALLPLSCGSLPSLPTRQACSGLPSCIPPQNENSSVLQT
jgi:hypothetical protein